MNATCHNKSISNVELNCCTQAFHPSFLNGRRSREQQLFQWHAMRSRRKLLLEGMEDGTEVGTVDGAPEGILEGTDDGCDVGE